MSIKVKYLDSEKWNHQIRSLYKKSNETLGVSSTLTERILSPTGDFHNPAEYYRKDGHKLAMLLKGDILIGFVCYVPRSDKKAEIQHLVIDPEYRKMKLGSFLMASVHNDILENYHEYTLSCLYTNSVALAFYRSLSFLAEDCVTEHYSQTDKINYSLIHFKNRQNT